MEIIENILQNCVTQGHKDGGEGKRMIFLRILAFCRVTACTVFPAKIES
jgi:hypothetical protein